MPSYTQENRPLRVDSPLGEDVLLLQKFSGTEGISRLFSYTIDLLAIRSVKPEDLLEKPLTLEISPLTGGQNRVVHGLVTSLTSLGRQEELFAYRVDIAPWCWLLSLTQDCRIFQEMTALEIIEQVFSDRGFSDYRTDCKGKLPKREFSVQYRESDLDFISRLLEHEGIFYFFEHTKDKHTLVLADHPGALKTCPGQDTVRLLKKDIPGVEEGIIDDLFKRTSVHTGKAALNDYFFEDPTGDLLTAVAGQGVGEAYDYPGGYKVRADGTRFTELRLEAEEANREVLHGSGNCASLIPGFRFGLKDSGDDDGEYLLLEVSHQGASSEYRSAPGKESEDGAAYRVAFKAIPYKTQYRPPRCTPTPVVHGAQTAVVVGPSGEEVYTDKYGRVKVSFHWDRQSPKDETSSCWIRVATTWAGNKWGAIQIPRVGQEVIVEFLEGDPDRPLITGSVYNAKMMPPFGATPTQSGLLTRSTPSGSAELANEFRFEDKKGEEEVFLHAEKDFKTEVENDQTILIGNDQITEIENEQSVAIEKNQTIKIAQGDRSVTLDEGDLVTKVAAGKITYEAMTSIELKVGTNTIKIEQSGITITGMKVAIEGKTQGEFKAAVIKVEGQAMTEIKGAMTQIKGDGMLMAKGGVIMIG